MSPSRRYLISTIGGVFLLALDQGIKWFARTHSSFTAYLYRPWIGFEYFTNPGVAFSLPVPGWLTLLITPIILLVFGLWAVQRKNKSLGNAVTIALCLLATGAISNFIDRVLFGVTIDYLRLYTSIINLADILIIIGVFLLLYSSHLNRSLDIRP